MHCSIWYYLRNLENVKNIHEVVLLFVKLQAKACDFTKSDLPPIMFSRFKLCKWYHIAQRITYGLSRVKIISYFGH